MYWTIAKDDLAFAKVVYLEVTIIEQSLFFLLRSLFSMVALKTFESDQAPSETCC